MYGYWLLSSAKNEINSTLSLASEGLVIALSLFIVLLIILLVLIIFGIVPRMSQARKIELSGHDNDWEAFVKLDPETVFAIDQTISVTVQLIGKDPQEVEQPNVILYDTSGDSQIQLTNDEDVDKYQWSGSGTLTYTNPGKKSAQYNIGDESHTVSIGEIEPAMTYLHYRTSKYVLIFAVLSAILASASLILTLQR